MVCLYDAVSYALMSELFTRLFNEGEHVTDEQYAVAFLYSPFDDLSSNDRFASARWKLQDNPLIPETDFF